MVYFVLVREITISSLLCRGAFRLPDKNGPVRWRVVCRVCAKKARQMLTAVVLPSSVLQVPLWLILAGFALACLGVIVITRAARADVSRTSSSADETGPQSFS